MFLRRVTSTSPFWEGHSTLPAPPLPTAAPCLLPYTQQKLWGDSEAETFPQDLISQALVSIPGSDAVSRRLHQRVQPPRELACRGCGRTRLARTCVQRDVGGVDHFELQAGQENSPLGKNTRRQRMSGRAAGVWDAAARSQAPWDGSSSLPSSHKLICTDPSPNPAGED